MPSSVEEDELATGGIGVGIILQVELFFRCVSSLMNLFPHWKHVFFPALLLLAKVFWDRYSSYNLAPSSPYTVGGGSLTLGRSYGKKGMHPLLAVLRSKQSPES